jgi:hypothetical protein
MLDLLHGEGRADVGQPDAADELLINPIISGDVGDLKFEEIICVAAHPVELDDLRQFTDGRRKIAEPLV